MQPTTSWGMNSQPSLATFSPQQQQQIALEHSQNESSFTLLFLGAAIFIFAALFYNCITNDEEQRRRRGEPREDTQDHRELASRDIAPTQEPVVGVPVGVAVGVPVVPDDGGCQSSHHDESTAVGGCDAAGSMCVND